MGEKEDILKQAEELLRQKTKQDDPMAYASDHLKQLQSQLMEARKQLYEATSVDDSIIAVYKLLEKEIEVDNHIIKSSAEYLKKHNEELAVVKFLINFVEMLDE